jgi:rare lipoprotein A (peptidoglycan hydrolase)
MKSINIRGKTALVGVLWLIALAMTQGCSTMTGSFNGANPTFYRSQPVGEIVPVAIKPLVETPPRGGKNTRSSSKISSKGNVGEASWYGPGFRGKKTASGEIFDDAKFTAAHKTMPLGSKAKVTNLNNHKSVEVEINDRGPYVKGRIIDLSQAAARALDIVERGTAEVRVEILNHD